MSGPAVQEERAQRRSAFPSLEVVPPTAAQQSPFLPFMLLLLYVVLVYLRPYEYLQYRETFRDVPLMPIVMGVMLVIWIPVPGKKYDAPQYSLMLGLVACIPISIISGERWLAGAQSAFLEFVPIAVLFIVAATLLNSPHRLRQMFFVLATISGVIALHGIGQAQNGIGWTGELLRQDRITYVGFLSDPNDLAMVLVIAVPMTLSFFRRGGSKLLAIFACAATALMLYGVYLTNSRGAVVALAGMLVVYSLLRHGRRRSLLVIPVLLAALIFASPNRIADMSADEESANARVEAWYEGLQMVKQYPLFGVGKGLFADHNNNLTAHNSFVLAAAEIGLIGYFFWLSLVALSAMMLLALVRAPPPESPLKSPHGIEGDNSWAEHQRLARILLYALTGCLGSAFFLSRTYTIPLYVLLAMIVGFYQSSHVRWPHLPSFALSSRFRRLVLLEIASLGFLWLTTRILLATG